MALQNLKVNVFLMSVTALLFVIKLFTAVITLNDDPTNFLVFSLTPSFSNDIFMPSINIDQYFILISDENGFVGDSIYYFLTQYLWWIMLTVTFFVVFLSPKKIEHIKNRNPPAN